MVSGSWPRPPYSSENGQSVNAKAGAFLPGVVIENGVAIVLDHVVIELLFGEAIDRIQQFSLLIRPGKIHALGFSFL